MHFNPVVGIVINSSVADPWHCSHRSHSPRRDPFYSNTDIVRATQVYICVRPIQNAVQGERAVWQVSAYVNIEASVLFTNVVVPMTAL